MNVWGELEVATTLRPKRRRLADYNRDDLRERWDNLDPMSPEEIAAHRQYFGAGAQADPDRMDSRQKADYFSGLHEKQEVYGEPLTPREQLHHDDIRDWAEHYLDDRHYHAQKQAQKWDALSQNPSEDVGKHPTPHDPDLTVNWAHQEQNSTNPYTRQRALDLKSAMKNMVNEGPLGQSKGRFNHQNYDDALSNMRIELQHHGRFRIPNMDDLSFIENPDEHHADNGVVNPRFSHGLGEPPDWAKDLPGADIATKRAYQINCQRAVLAAEARHRGYNVEAQRNFAFRDGHEKNDRRLNDHGIASWFQGSDGSIPKWQDAWDEFPHAEPGPQHWDAMTDHIAKNWGPGARGAVMMSYPSRLNPGANQRHIISVKVHDDGTVRYSDPQSSEGDVGEKWRTKTGYSIYPSQRASRAEYKAKEADGRIAPSTGTMGVNTNPSALRFMRLDDKEIHPAAAQHMVDRGNAPSIPVGPPAMPRGK